jgi:CheY-like chemotaxis protein
MTDDIFSLRAVVVSGSADDQDLFRQAAAPLSVPIETVAASDTVGACNEVDAGADLVFIDGALASEQISPVIAAARAIKNPPFTMLLTAPGTAVGSFETDGVAAKPADIEQARQLIEQSVRIRLPSRVLLVDDSPTMRSIVRKILGATRFPFAVSEAHEGAAALNLVRDGQFDIVFLDYNMPGFDGFETLSEFKRDNRPLNVVMMTSTHDDAVAERARKQGAGFLKKPFFPADIEAVLCGFYGLLALNPRRA